MELATGSTAGAGPSYEVVWSDGLAAAVGRETAWIWQGFLAPGNTTLLTSQWKAGKTTLVALLLAHRQAGGTFAGRALTAGKAVVVSEEPLDHWHRRAAKLGFGDGVGFLCQPFVGAPSFDD